MNLSDIASGYIGAINPQVICNLRMSNGYTQSADFKQIPAYILFPGIPCQIQPLSSSDLRKLDGLNLQGIYQAVYMNGDIEGVDRSAIKGGDLFDMPDGTVWLVTQVLEHWADWTKFAVTKQVASAQA